MKIKAMVLVLDDFLDAALLAHMIPKHIDMLLWTLCKISPTSRTCDLLATNKKDFKKTVKKAITRNCSSLPSTEGPFGLLPDFSNLEECAVKTGWNEMEFWLQHPSVPKSKQPQGPAPLQLTNFGAP